MIQEGGGVSLEEVEELNGHGRLIQTMIYMNDINGKKPQRKRLRGDGGLILQQHCDYAGGLAKGSMLSSIREPPINPSGPSIWERSCVSSS
jgi:hypothetical protein